MSFLSQPKTFKLRNSYVNGFLDCSGDIILRSGNVIIGNISQPGYNANQLSVLVHGRTQMNGNVIVNGNLFVSSNNIALGLRAGNITNGIQDGVPNGLNTTAVGSFSGMNHSGINNIFIGSVAGQTSSTTYFSRTGSNNTYVGYRTSANNSAWANSTAVGTGAVITASNQIVLGTATETVFAPGNVIVGGDISCNGNVLFTYAPRLSYTNVPGYTVNNIGYSTTTTGTGTLATAFNALSSINTIGVSIPVVGVWLINYKGSINTASSGSVGGGTIGFGLSTTASNTGNTIALGTTRTASTPGAVGAAYTASSNIYSLHGTHIYIGASTTIYLNCNITTIAALAAASCSLTLTRIA